MTGAPVVRAVVSNRSGRPHVPHHAPPGCSRTRCPADVPRGRRRPVGRAGRHDPHAHRDVVGVTDTDRLGVTDPVTASPTPTAPPTPAPTPTGSPTPSGSPSVTPRPHHRAAWRPPTPAALPGPGEPETLAAADFVARTLARGSGGLLRRTPTRTATLRPRRNYRGPRHHDRRDARARRHRHGPADAGTASLAYLASTTRRLHRDRTGGDTYVGPTAKAVIGIVALGGGPPRRRWRRPRRDAASASRPPTGRFSDTGSGDYSNTIGQALAIIALAPGRGSP